MPELIRIPVEGDQPIIAEVDKLDISSDDVVLAAPVPGKAIAEIPNKLQDGFRAIRPAVAEFIEALKGSGPDVINIEFGVKIGGETGVILAKGTADVNFKVAMEWRRSPEISGEDS